MKRLEFIGKIKMDDYSANFYDCLYIGDSILSDSILDFEFKKGEKVFVSYYISDKELKTKEEFLEHYISSIVGSIDTLKCAHVYGSELTGYMWTEEGLKIDGHDIIKELSSYDNKYCYFSIKCLKSHRNDSIDELLK